MTSSCNSNLSRCKDFEEIITFFSFFFFRHTFDFWLSFSLILQKTWEKRKVGQIRLPDLCLSTVWLVVGFLTWLSGESPNYKWTGTNKYDTCLSSWNAPFPKNYSSCLYLLSSLGNTFSCYYFISCLVKSLISKTSWCATAAIEAFRINHCELLYHSSYLLQHLSWNINCSECRIKKKKEKTALNEFKNWWFILTSLDKRNHWIRFPGFSFVFVREDLELEWTWLSSWVSSELKGKGTRYMILYLCSTICPENLATQMSCCKCRIKTRKEQ